MSITTTQRVKIVSKPSLSNTLKSIEIGVPTLFSTNQFKVQLARVAASELKRKEGYEFTVSEDGMVDEYIVTCLVKPKPKVKKQLP